jgi:3-hydroxyacyl-CoA dehydrogenase, C-terminal domain
VLGKTTVLSKDRAGFIVNMLLIPYLNGAVRMLDEGFATREDIDTAVSLGLAHPMDHSGSWTPSGWTRRCSLPPCCSRSSRSRFYDYTS